MNLHGASPDMIRTANAYVTAENRKWPEELRQLTPSEMPAPRGSRNPVEVWRSSRFLVQVYAVPGHPEMERLSVNRTELDEATGRWREGISWDELQALKEQCGRGEFDAVEVYPRKGDEVNVANMRHLWVFYETALSFIWRP